MNTDCAWKRGYLTVVFFCLFVHLLVFLTKESDMRQRGKIQRKNCKHINYHLSVDAKYFFQIEDVHSLVAKTDLPCNLTETSVTVRPSTKKTSEQMYTPTNKSINERVSFFASIWSNCFLGQWLLNESSHSISADTLSGRNEWLLTSNEWSPTIYLKQSEGALQHTLA